MSNATRPSVGPVRWLRLRTSMGEMVLNVRHLAAVFVNAQEGGFAVVARFRGAADLVVERRHEMRDADVVTRSIFETLTEGGWTGEEREITP